MEGFALGQAADGVTIGINQGQATENGHGS